jgi:cell division protein FtsL
MNKTFSGTSILLILLVITSALAVVYVADLNRRLFIDYQNAQTTHNQLYIDWGKLLLEQSTWATQARVQTLAEQKLNMQLPAAMDIVMINKD